MKPHRRFNLYTSKQLDFPTIRSGRVLDRLSKIGLPEHSLFLCALESGLVHAASKLSAITIDFLASDREELVDAPTEDGRTIRVAVRFDATNLLDGKDSETRWRLYKAGILGLLAIAERKIPSHPARHFITSAHAAIPATCSSEFPIPTDEQWAIFYDFALYSKGRRSGYLTVELTPPKSYGPPYDFQPVFDRITAALATARLGTWQGDSGNDIEFKSTDLAAAQACVEQLLADTFDGTFTLSLLRD